jgi:hypothetical protein
MFQHQDRREGQALTVGEVPHHQHRDLFERLADEDDLADGSSDRLVHAVERT